MNKRRQIGEQWTVNKFGIEYRHVKNVDGTISRERITPYVIENNKNGPKSRLKAKAPKRAPAKEIVRLPDRVIDVTGKKYVRISSKLSIQVDKNIPDDVAIKNWLNRYQPT